MAFYGTNAAVAWVNTTGTGTIRDSFNVTSVTRNGEGDISVNFTNNITDNDMLLLGGQTIMKELIVTQVE